MRTGELVALKWEDIDLEHGVLHVHRSTERRTRRGKGTKTGFARRLPIERTLEPLLRAMRDEGDATGNVMKVPSDASRTFRRLLLRAGVGRTELHERAATRKVLTFYDLRSTGSTWQAVRGDDALKIMERAGHKDMATTMMYVRTAQQLVDGFGEPFPELPPNLLGSKSVFAGRNARPERTRASQPYDNWRKRTGINWRKRTGIEPSEAPQSTEITRARSGGHELEAAQVGGAPMASGACAKSVCESVDELSDAELRAATRVLIEVECYRVAMVLVAELDRRARMTMVRRPGG